MSGLVRITPSSLHDEFSGLYLYSANSLTDPIKTQFYSKSEQNSNVVFFLKKHTARITGYVIQCANGNGWYPRSWIIEGSQNGINWTKLDEQNNNDELNEDWKFVKIRLASESDPIQYIRITQTGNNSNNGEQLIISYFDIFGKIEAI